MVDLGFPFTSFVYILLSPQLPWPVIIQVSWSFLPNLLQNLPGQPTPQFGNLPPKKPNGWVGSWLHPHHPRDLAGNSNWVNSGIKKHIRIIRMLSRAWTALGYAFYILLHRIHAIHAFGKLRWNPENPQCLAPQFGRRWNTWFSSESPQISLKSPCSPSNENGQNWNINSPTIIHRCMILGFDSNMTWNFGTLQHQHYSQLIPSCSKNMTHIIFNHLKSSSNLVFFPQFTQFLRLFQPQPGPTAPLFAPLLGDHRDVRRHLSHRRGNALHARGGAQLGIVDLRFFT